MFGRGKYDDDDPFAALREQSTDVSTRVGIGSEAPTAGGSDDHGETARHAISGTPDDAPRRARSRRGTDALLILLAIALSLGVAAAVVSSEERDARERGVGVAERAADQRGNPGTTTTGQGRTGRDVRPARVGSLVRPGDATRGLAALQGTLRPGERITFLRLGPDRIIANTRLRGGRQRVVAIPRDLQPVVTENAGSAGPRRGVALGSIDRVAPWRAIQRAARRGGFPASRADYVVLLVPPLGGALQWSVMFRGVAPRNTQWIADAAGRSVARPGEQTTASAPRSGATQVTGGTLRITVNGRTTELTGEQALRVSRCIQRAGSDGAAIQRCLP